MSRAHGARPACSLAICFAPVASYLPCVATITLMSVAMENKCWVRHETHVATSPAFLMSRAHRGSTACVHARHRSPVVRAARSAGPSPLSFRLWWRPPAARAPMWRAHVEEAQHAEVQDVSEARATSANRASSAGDDKSSVPLASSSSDPSSLVPDGISTSPSPPSPGVRLLSARSAKKSRSVSRSVLQNPAHVSFEPLL